MWTTATESWENKKDLGKDPTLRVCPTVIRPTTRYDCTFFHCTTFTTPFFSNVLVKLPSLSILCGITVVLINGFDLTNSTELLDMLHLRPSTVVYSKTPLGILYYWITQCLYTRCCGLPQLFQWQGQQYICGIQAIATKRVSAKGCSLRDF